MFEVFSLEEIPITGFRRVLKAIAAQDGTGDFLIKKNGKNIQRYTNWKKSNVMHIVDVLNKFAPSSKSIPIPVYEVPETSTVFEGRVEVLGLDLEQVGYSNKERTQIEYNCKGDPINGKEERQSIEIIGALSSDMRLTLYKCRVFCADTSSKSRKVSFGDFKDGM